MTYIPFNPTRRHIEILEEVKKRLEYLIKHPDEGLSYVCVAILESFDFSIETEKEDLKDWIHHMIHPYFTITDWLNKTHKIPLASIYKDFANNIYRIEWVEHLIQTLKEHIS